MNIEELKQAIEQRAGVPASLLTGETAEENIALAKAFLAYKKEYAAKQPKSTREQFADWFNKQQGIEPQDTAAQALAEIEEQARIDAGGYPRIADGGNVLAGGHLPDGRPASEQFADWAGQQMAFNPFKEDGWTHLT